MGTSVDSGGALGTMRALSRQDDGIHEQCAVRDCGDCDQPSMPGHGGVSTSAATWEATSRRRSQRCASGEVFLGGDGDASCWRSYVGCSGGAGGDEAYMWMCVAVSRNSNFFARGGRGRGNAGCSTRRRFFGQERGNIDVLAEHIARREKRHQSEMSSDERR